jgi:hypothetical protein
MNFFKWVFVVVFVALTIMQAQHMFNPGGEPCHPAYCTF